MRLTIDGKWRYVAAEESEANAGDAVIAVSMPNIPAPQRDDLHLCGWRSGKCSRPPAALIVLWDGRYADCYVSCEKCLPLVTDEPVEKEVRK